MCQHLSRSLDAGKCFKSVYVEPSFRGWSSTGCVCGERQSVLVSRNFLNMPAGKSDSVSLSNDEYPFVKEALPERLVFNSAGEDYRVAFGHSKDLPSRSRGLADPLFHQNHHTAGERRLSSPLAVLGRTFSDFTDSNSPRSSDGQYSSTEKGYGASEWHDTDRVARAADQTPSGACFNLGISMRSVVTKTPAPGDRNPSNFGRSLDSGSIENGYGRLDDTNAATTTPRQTNGQGFKGSHSSIGLSFPTVVKTDLSDIEFPLETPETHRNSEEQQHDLRVGSESASWARQTEEGYNLQTALAVRLAAEADFTSETRLFGQHCRETSCSAARLSVEATAYRFWVNGSLGYNDVVQDGFYYVWGIDPHVWNICNYPHEANKLPSLESLRAVDPTDSAIEVVLVDKNGDYHLRELVEETEADAQEDFEAQKFAELLGTRVCKALGGEASFEADLTRTWTLSTSRLQHCLSSIVMPLGSLSVGLCRHRALLFKTLADSVNLPCRIARGCKYCGSEDGASCIVLCDPERECYVDLIAKPGSLSSADSVWTNMSWSFRSPIHFPDFKRSFSGEERAWSRGFTTDGESSGRSGDGRSPNEGVKDRGEKGPRDWFPSGSAQMTFSDDAPGADLWAVMKVSEEHAYSVFRDQLQGRLCEGKGPAKTCCSGNISFVAGVNPVSMNSANEKVEPPSESAQEEDVSAQPSQSPDVSDDDTSGNHANSHDGSHDSESVGKQLERLAVLEDWQIQWDDIIIKEKVGAGSFGTVHRGDWHGSDVAVKVISQQDVGEKDLTEFLREVSIMKRLRHPNVVLFMGAVTTPPNLSIVTEYLARGSLFRILHKSQVRDMLSEKRRLKMAIDVAKGMNYLHRCNPPIVHRDLKSPNLLVDKEWTVKVCDFGLSRFKGNTFLTSRSGAGTPEWMAPEVLRAEPSNEKSDVYSFGVVLWELVTLQLPWNGLSPAQVVGAVGFQNRRLQIPKDLHPDITVMIENCCSTDPQVRPSFAGIMETLRALQRNWAGPFAQPLSQKAGPAN